MLLLVTNCGFQGRVGLSVDMLKEPDVIAPKFRSFFVAEFLSSVTKRHSKSLS
jgi:hypothetical protein